jgi:ferrous iron transport protein B
VGNPNVGKSALFGALTGRYVEVSNYPGTTVEVARGRVAFDGTETALIDTPGVGSLLPRSLDEKVTVDVLTQVTPWAVIQVADTKNLRRALLLTFQLAEYEVPLLLVLNMTDEAEALGIEVDAERLGRMLGGDVVRTIATRRDGLDQLRARLAAPHPIHYRIRYDGAIEEAAERIAALMPESLRGRRGWALRALGGDLPAGLERATEIQQVVTETAAQYPEPLPYVITRQRLKCADCLLGEVWHAPESRPDRWPERIGRLALHPIWGWPLLGLVLFGMYEFVGVFGAGTLVGWMEEVLFGQYLNPLAIRATQWIPFALARDFLVGQYGLVTMALAYGFAIVLPIVFTFFLAFSLLEDSGYLPRLAVMANRPFKAMGLNGKAVLPMVLGLGCDTMATLTTRVLETRKERVQVTLLLALGVPCSAQLGVLLGMMAFLSWQAVLLWGAVVVATLFAVGWLAARLLPGSSSDFILELPPIRWPQLGNILVKTLARLEWYLKEVLPLFMLGTAILFVLDKVGALAWLEGAVRPLISGMLGLPPETAGVFLVGFVRRDFGAAGLFSLARAGLLTPTQMVVSLVVITLFVPCIANLLVIAREHGRRTALWVAAFVFPFAFLVGGALNLAVHLLGIEF